MLHSVREGWACILLQWQMCNGRFALTEVCILPFFPPLLSLLNECCRLPCWVDHSTCHISSKATSQYCFWVELVVHKCHLVHNPNDLLNYRCRTHQNLQPYTSLGMSQVTAEDTICCSSAANFRTSKDLHRQAATCLEVCCKAAQVK